MKDFLLHDNFNKNDLIGKLSVSSVIFKNTNEFDWFILVFKRLEAKNIFDLTTEEKELFWQDINKLGEIVKEIYRPLQINIAMFSNITPQLHCHIIPRFENDAAWPKSVFEIKTTKKLEVSDNAEIIKTKMSSST